MPQQLKSFGLTIKNNHPYKPNEDFYKADDTLGIYILADGITSTPAAGEQYPSPSGGELTARLFCDTVYEQLCAATEGINPASLRAASLTANRAIQALNTRQRRYELANFLNIDYFGCVGTVVAIAQNTLHLAHVGDGMVFLARHNHLQRLTSNQTQNVTEYKKTAQTQPNFSARELTIAIRRDFRNHSQATGQNGEPVGYGVYTGQENVQDFIQIEKNPLQPGDAVLLLSDGFSPIMAQNPAIFPRQQNPQTFLPWLAAENSRYETTSDDKTALLICIE